MLAFHWLYPSCCYIGMLRCMFCDARLRSMPFNYSVPLSASRRAMATFSAVFRPPASRLVSHPACRLPEIFTLHSFRDSSQRYIQLHHVRRARHSYSLIPARFKATTLVYVSAHCASTMCGFPAQAHSKHAGLAPLRCT